MSAFFGALGTFRGTFGSTLNGQVQSRRLLRQGAQLQAVRSSDRSTPPNIPTSVYTRLIDGVNRGLPTFHRYLKLRKRMMGVPELHYYDLYAPLVASVDLTYTADEAREARHDGAQAARRPTTRRRRTARSTNAGSISIPIPASGRAPTRTAAPTTCIRTC